MPFDFGKLFKWFGGMEISKSLYIRAIEMPVRRGSTLTEEAHDEQGFAGRQPLGAEGGRLGEQRGLAAALPLRAVRAACWTCP